MALNLDFSNFDVDLSGLGDFSLDLSNLSPLLQDTTSDPSPLDIRKAEIAAEVAAKAAQQPVQSVGQTADLSGYYNALRQGTTISDIDTVGQNYDQVLNEILANQGIVDTDYAEAQPLGGGIGFSKPTVSSFTLPDYEPRELGEFQGNLSEHTSSSLGQIKEFQARLEPLMAPVMARLQTQGKLDYKDAVEQAYLQNPEIQALYNEYDVKPFRATEDGSIYLYDPFTFGEIRTLEVKDNDLKKAIKAVTQIGVSILTGGAGATMGLTGAAAAATSAAVSGFTTAAYGGDKDAILNSVLMAGGTSLLKGAVDKVKQGVENVAEETLQTISPELKASIPEIVPTNVSEAAVANPSSVIDLAGDPSAFGNIDIGAFTPETVASTLTDSQHFTNTIKRIVDDVGGDAAYKNLTPDQFGQQLLKHGGGRAYRQIFEYGGDPRALVDIPDEIISMAGGVGNVPDFIMETTMEDYTRPPSLRTETKVDISKLEDTPVTETQPTRESFLPSEQPDGGGGGGAAGGTGLAGGATTTTSGSVSVTPTIDYTAPGAVTSSLFSDVIAPAATAASTVTQTSPITATATTAPVTEETQTTTTEPTSILEDTTADTTTAPDTIGGGSTGGVEDPVSTGGAEGTGAEGGASGGTDDGSGTEGDGASGQEGGDDTAGDGTDAGGGAGDAGDAEGAGDGTGEGEGTGEGTGDGDGSGDGTGRGSGAGGGLGIGGAGGIGTSMFSDYLYGFQRPQILELAPMFEPYQAPAAYDPQANYANTVADQIRNLTSFPALSQDQVQNRLGLFNDALLQEAVMQNLYGAGGR